MESFLEQLPSWIEAFRFPVLGRLALATALGALVGLERELAGKPAGLRTNILICVGATLLTEASLGIATSGFATHELVRSDPGRIAAQIVSGIGFIGAGTILVARGNVLGLTTAATLWVVAAIGITVGIGAYVEAIGAAVLVFLVLFLIGRIENRVLRARAERTLRVAFSAPHGAPDAISDLLADLGIRAQPVSMKRSADGAEYVYTITGADDAKRRLLNRLAGTEGVRAFSLE
jgi:putative Mg2+ transporter-C (MgtC) family protein